MNRKAAIIIDKKWVRILLVLAVGILAFMLYPSGNSGAQGASGYYVAVAQQPAGLDVRAVQQKLASYGYTIAVDGIFGPQTERVVRKWQEANGLKVDGIVGPITLASLGFGKTQPPQQNSTPAPSEPAGLWNLPFAPSGLSGQEEMIFYRKQWGLPEVFDGLGRRESRYRNDVTSPSGCCSGYWQVHKIHINIRGAWCNVNEVSDYKGTSALSKQKNACMTAMLYKANGLDPWSLG